MTTREAEARYLADHIRSTKGAAPNIYNPREVPVETLPVIYGFNSGGTYSGFYGRIIAEDGVFLGAHSCTHEGYMRSDLGMYLGSRRDEDFRNHYPDGYRTEFVPLAEVEGHAGLQAALEKARAK